MQHFVLQARLPNGEGQPQWHSSAAELFVFVPFSAEILQLALQWLDSLNTLKSQFWQNETVVGAGKFARFKSVCREMLEVWRIVNMLPRGHKTLRFGLNFPQICRRLAW